mmetsp:Transcript_4529/g.15044  ORF Transcript_4529/g.15044 Transcript_4529/m.15044 type:complete len:369 (-) Transcript_4529:988-2094(-)
MASALAAAHDAPRPRGPRGHAPALRGAPRAAALLLRRVVALRSAVGLTLGASRRAPSEEAAANVSRPRDRPTLPTPRRPDFDASVAWRTRRRPFTDPLFEDHDHGNNNNNSGRTRRDCFLFLGPGLRRCRGRLRVRELRLARRRLGRGGSVDPLARPRRDETKGPRRRRRRRRRQGLLLLLGVTQVSPRAVRAHGDVRPRAAAGRRASGRRGLCCRRPRRRLLAELVGSGRPRRGDVVLVPGCLRERPQAGSPRPFGRPRGTGGVGVPRPHRRRHGEHFARLRRGRRGIRRLRRFQLLRQKMARTVLAFGGPGLRLRLRTTPYREPLPRRQAPLIRRRRETLERLLLLRRSPRRRKGRPPRARGNLLL